MGNSALQGPARYCSEIRAVNSSPCYAYINLFHIYNWFITAFTHLSCSCPCRGEEQCWLCKRPQVPCSGIWWVDDLSSSSHHPASQLGEEMLHKREWAVPDSRLDCHRSCFWHLALYDCSLYGGCAWSSPIWMLIRLYHACGCCRLLTKQLGKYYWTGHTGKTLVDSKAEWWTEAYLDNFLFLCFLKHFIEHPMAGELCHDFINKHHRSKPLFSFLFLYIFLQTGDPYYTKPK